MRVFFWCKGCWGKIGLYNSPRCNEDALGNQICMLYSNLLVEEARLLRNKIIAEQVDSGPCLDIFGKAHSEKCTKSWDSFMDCMTFHLLTVFSNDAAETEWYHISNGLKKHNRVPIRQFIQHIVDFLSGAIVLCVLQPTLESIYKDSWALQWSRSCKSHSKSPMTWQLQYSLTEGCNPESLWKL